MQQAALQLRGRRVAHARKDDLHNGLATVTPSIPHPLHKRQFHEATRSRAAGLCHNIDVSWEIYTVLVSKYW